MDRPTRSILVAIAALLLPFVGVIWYLVLQISHAEDVLSDTHRRQAETSLARVRPIVLRTIESFLRDTFASVELARLREEAPTALRALERADRSIDHAFLLDGGMQLVHPRLPAGPGLPLPFGRAAAAARPDPEKQRDLSVQWESARILELAGDLTGAITMYRKVLETSRSVEATRQQAIQIRVHAILAALLEQVGEPEKAEEELTSALRKLSTPQGGPNIAVAKVSCLLQRARIIFRRSPAEGVQHLLSLGDTIAKGYHDDVPDELLEHVMHEIEEVVVPTSPDTNARWRAIADEDAWRLEGRAFAADLNVFGLPLISRPRPAEARADMISVNWSDSGGNPSLLAVKKLAAGDAAETAWAGLHVDLRSLALDKLLPLLDDRGSSFRLDILLPSGESLTADPRPETRTALPEAAPRVEAPLAWPLEGFTLRSSPRDPALLAAQTRELLVGKIILVAAFFVVASMGATFLVRVVRREAELSRLKMDFVSRVSHELKTPLALIRMYGDTLAMGRAPEPERVAKFAGIIAKEADRLTRMIENVLDFSRMEAGTKEYRVEPTDLAALLEGIADTYEPHLHERGFRLELSAGPMAEVQVDREAMTQCFINLVDNAVKYTDDGPRVVEVRVFGHNGHAVVEFSDRGIGVPDAERERIFQKFYRASTAGERPGAGLGLAMVRHFVEAHGGEVAVKPRAGGGSVFTVTLPASPPSGKSRSRTADDKEKRTT